MFDVSLPQTFKGVLIATVAVFVVITALITSGVMPVVLALVIGALLAYFIIYLPVVKFNQVFRDGGLRSGGENR